MECGFDNVSGRLKDQRFGKFVCFWVLGKGERVTVDGVTVGFFEGVLFGSANDIRSCPLQAIEALTQKIHPDTVFSSVFLNVDFFFLADVPFSLSTYACLAEWLRPDMSRWNAKSMTLSL